jgi:hypothetical protein
MSRPVSRRNFLKGAGATAVAGAAAMAGSKRIPGIISSAKAETPTVDTTGSLIGAVRVNPMMTYLDVPELLKTYIQSGETDEESWERIREKIDYIYDNLDEALEPLFGGKKQGSWTTLRQDVLNEIDSGKKLLFKPNIVAVNVLDFPLDGTPGPGVTGCTDWTMMAALMRWFHDKLGIRYGEMAIGEAGTLVPAYTGLVDTVLKSFFPPGTPIPEHQIIPSEALFEGKFQLPGFPPIYVGWPGYFLRKYLQDKGYESGDDPMNGYLQSISGTYVPPGQANHLAMYDLNQVGLQNERVREVSVPGGENYSSIVLHKAVVGGDADHPGCVLISVPKCKIHTYNPLTNCVKNIGMGGWPMFAGEDNDPTTSDWLYSYPNLPVPGLKGRVVKSKHDVKTIRFGDEALNPAFPYLAAETEEFPDPLENPKSLEDFYYYYGGMSEKRNGEYVITETDGWEGTMTDIFLAVKSQVPHVLNIVDGIAMTNIAHGGSPDGVLVPEGILLASEDPVALDLFCMRYLYKNLPRGLTESFGISFGIGVPKPVFDGTKIITTDGIDSPVLRDTHLAYAAGRGLGILDYYVEGKNKYSPMGGKLVSQGGHFGTIVGNNFQEIFTENLYYAADSIIYKLQATSWAYLEAVDALTLANYGFNPGYKNLVLELQEPGNTSDVLYFNERGNRGFTASSIGHFGIGINLLGRGRPEHSSFYLYSRGSKYSQANWNVAGIDSQSEWLISLAIVVAAEMAQGPEIPGGDPFFPPRPPPEPGTPPMPGMPVGNGNWPSLQFAMIALADVGNQDLSKFASDYVNSPYAQHVLGIASYKLFITRNLPQEFFGVELPLRNNMEHTTDPAKVLTAEFYDAQGTLVERW